VTADVIDLVDVGCVEAGQAILGAALIGGPAARDAVASLESNDLTDTRQRAVLEAMHALIAREAPIEPTTVLGELRAGGSDVRMPAGRDCGVYLADLMEHAGNGHPSFHLRVVLEYALRREVRQAGIRITQAAGAIPVGELVDFALNEHSRVLRAGQRLHAAKAAGE
jgi:replicative DNA helicase